MNLRNLSPPPAIGGSSRESVGDESHENVNKRGTRAPVPPSFRQSPDDQAHLQHILTWLQRQPAGSVATTYSGAARVLRWDRNTTRRRLQAFADLRLIRVNEIGGGVLIALIAPDQGDHADQRGDRALHKLMLPAVINPDQGDHAPDQGPRSLRAHRDGRTPLDERFMDMSPAELRMAIPVHDGLVIIPDQAMAAAPIAALRPRRLMQAAIWSIIGRVLLTMIIAVLTGAMLYVSIQLNAWYAESRGATPEARDLWVKASVAAELFEAVLALAGATLSYRRQWAMAMLSYTTALVIVAFTSLAAVGFAATNVADTTAKRGATVEQRQALDLQLARANADLAALPSARPVGMVDAALQGAQALVSPGIWKSSRSCSDVTIAQSGQACADVLKLRAERSVSERRDRLVQEVAEATAKRTNLAAVTQADPQAEAAATIANWLTRGLTGVTSLDIQLLFLVLVVLIVRLPVSVGPMVVVALWQPGRRRPVKGGVNADS